MVQSSRLKSLHCKCKNKSRDPRNPSSKSAFNKVEYIADYTHYYFLFKGFSGLFSHSLRSICFCCDIRRLGFSFLIWGSLLSSKALNAVAILFSGWRSESLSSVLKCVVLCLGKNFNKSLLSLTIIYKIYAQM